MTLPALPTDNLYKFLGVGGLVMILASSWLTSDAQFRRIELISKETHAFEEHTHKLIWNLVDHVLAEHKTPEARAKSLDLNNPFLQTQLQQVTDRYQKRIAAIHTEVNTMIFMLSILEKIGFVLAPTGFGLWWYKVQRLQDSILKKECENVLAGAESCPILSGTEQKSGAATPKGT
jgi:hypothetical protein